MTIHTARDGRFIITCNVGHCPTTFDTPAPSGEAARAMAAEHNYGWYTRRQRGRIVDACQWHLGGCCIAHTRPGEPGVDPAAVLPPPRLEPMSADAAAWVRANAWNGVIRAEYKRAPNELLLCGCQHGPSRWCQDGQHSGCHRECPHASAEAWVWTARGHVAQFAEPYQHPYPYKPGRRPQQPDAWARLWLADRVCRWVCACPCHIPVPARPVRYEAVALPGLELIGATHA